MSSGYRRVEHPRRLVFTSIGDSQGDLTKRAVRLDLGKKEGVSRA
jgi:hypothetical protein